MRHRNTRFTREGLGALLREHGRRATRQRLAVYAALARRPDHPTAEWLSEEVRRRIPGLSLATVYKALQVLVRIGAAGRLTDSDGTWRYDARTDMHDHRRCLYCGRVEDVEAKRRARRMTGPAGKGFRTIGYRLEFLGHCIGCAGKGAPATNRSALRRGESE